MQAAFNSLRQFNYAEATIHLWSFKDSSTAAKYTAFYVPTDEALETQLKNFAISEMQRITEFAEYTYISQTNENSCLVINQQVTDFPNLQALVDRPEADHRVPELKKLIGSNGYVVKFSKNGETVYAIKRSSSSWKTAYSKKFLNVIFENGELIAIENNAFSIEKNFDFYAKGGVIYIANKRAFESAANYKAAYLNAFTDLQNAPEFTALFTDLAPIINYVGSNSIQLRRMAVVEEKNLFADPNFLPTLQQVSIRRGWGLNFDNATGRLIPCEGTAKTIIQLLLDLRLMSEITNINYDVPDAVQI